MISLRALTMVILIVGAFLTGGCWDRQEIENRGFLLGIAIDTATQELGQHDLERAFQQAGRRRYRVNYELRKQLAGGAAEGSSDRRSEENIVYSAEGESMFAATRSISAEAPGLFIEDLQVVLISEELARHGIKEIFDFFDRDPEMRRRARIYITKGRAEDFFQIKTQTGKLVSLELAQLVTAGERKSPTFGGINEFGDLTESMYSKRCFALPMLYLEKGVIKAAGSAVFDSSGKMVAVGNEYESVGGKILLKRLQHGLVVVPNPDNPDTIVVFELMESKITVEPDFSAEPVRFIVKGEFFGNIGESVPLQDQPFNAQCITKIARAVADEYASHVQAFLRFTQMTRTDTSRLGDLIYRVNPHYWQKIKDRWDEEIYPAVQVEVDFKVRIRGTGMTL